RATVARDQRSPRQPARALRDRLPTPSRPPPLPCHRFRYCHRRAPGIPHRRTRNGLGAQPLLALCVVEPSSSTSHSTHVIPSGASRLFLPRSLLRTRRPAWSRNLSSSVSFVASTSFRPAPSSCLGAPTS